MKNYNKILEAVHRGINLALDDFDDELIGQLTLTIKDQNITKDYLTLMNYVVDLGLPSGTLWCKFNVGCDTRFNYDRYKHEYCDGKSDWYGNYYAWGDLNGLKNEYIADNYTHAQYSGYANIYYMTSKYAYNKLTLLLPEDDPAYQKIKINNFKFHTPTKELAEELIDNTSHKWKTNYLGYEGLNGMLLKSKNNDNFIFLPAAGIYNGDKLKNNNILGVYWTSDLSEESDSEAHCFWFDDDDIYKPHFANHIQRYLGLQIRPVINL